MIYNRQGAVRMMMSWTSSIKMIKYKVRDTGLKKSKRKYCARTREVKTRPEKKRIDEKNKEKKDDRGNGKKRKR